MLLSSAETMAALLVRAGAHVCALPLPQVTEIMRPLPVRPLAGTPLSVLGLCVLRGTPVAAMDLGALLQPHSTAPIHRMVGVRLGERRALLGVEDVLGIGSLDPHSGLPMPPLLQNTHGEAVKEIFELDKDLFLLLDAARLLPPGDWQQLLSQHESL